MNWKPDAPSSRCCLLCPGPSLANLLGDELRHDHCTLIGVNRAAIAFDCDVWACLDSDAVAKFHKDVIGSPILLTTRSTPMVIGRAGIVWPKTFNLSDLDAYYPSDRDIWWAKYSATTALVYAAAHGAKRIDVFGADMIGTLDYDGVPGGERRDENRWIEERQIWDRLVAVLSNRDCKVTRHA